LNIGNTKIKFLIKYTFYVIDIVKKDKCCDFNPNVESRVVLRQPEMLTFEELIFKRLIFKELIFFMLILQRLTFRGLTFKKLTL